MIDDINNFMKIIIRTTFGFEPIIETIELPNKTFQVTLDGTAQERAEMMGKEAHTFQAIKMLLRVFARKRKVYSYLYIKKPL